MKNEIASTPLPDKKGEEGERDVTALVVRDKRRVRIDVDGMWSNIVDTGREVPMELFPGCLESVCQQLTKKMYGSHMGGVRD